MGKQCLQKYDKTHYSLNN